ncbi:UDP-N-acetylmuramoyl-tripeptide--D-alanyl-D-alanine ligase [Chryseomicrobium aureum]|uniref:UDP-N-acetylmuramoyl-tripeptide--D-alanyl-D- alanine ligase n=1 Tax=Chryseomicrobium aureum TaxID=1441723 RepID=UPI00195B81F5|nr:UDP-N-acetylmuramoyl-tripeptide--D-alanyl-D-alanine ligase [Chryseomicrobium aureum]MBM7707044.1 UDP-N-acetylmuramoyl-tripeptide--D-alanyl-D-alanine ligase [Chryseomicrobium aureum]
MKKTLRELATWLGADAKEFGDVIVTGASLNTRTLQPGELFIPFRGEQVNGHKFVEQAFEQGASAALWLKDEPNPPTDRPLLFVEDPAKALQTLAAAYRQELKATFVGVTGSNGKTSTKDLLAGLCEPYFKTIKTQGNFNNELGLPLTLLAIDEDTEVAVLEMGMSSFGEIEFLSNLAKPAFTVITNIGEAHLQDLGSREGITKAKMEIISGMSPEGKLFFDGDEPLLLQAVAEKADLHAIPYGKGENCTLRLTSTAFSTEGTQFTTEGEVEGDFVLRVLGEHQAKNALAAILIGRELGLTVDQIKQGLKDVILTDMRMQVMETDGPTFINDAYNAAPTSMQAAIHFLRDADFGKKKWLVLGDMLELGEAELAYHAQLAASINKQDFTGVALIGPRMKALYAELQGSFGEAVYWTDEMESLQQHLTKKLTSDDLVLLKGSRGMKVERAMETWNRK